LAKTASFVSGLRRADFQILEDGKEQKPASFGAAETPFAAAIVIDTSGSMDARLSPGAVSRDSVSRRLARGGRRRGLPLRL